MNPMPRLFLLLGLIVSSSALATTIRPPVAARVSKRGPTFRVPANVFPTHLALPALSYTSLGAATAGTLKLLAGSTGAIAMPQIALVAWTVGFPFALTIAQLAATGGSGVAKAMGGSETDDPRLKSLAADAAALVGVPAPKVFEIKSREPNAFASAGFGSRDLTVAVTTGLREILNEDEVGAVLAHEMGHLRHKDVLRNMHIAAATAGLGGIYETGRYILESSNRESRKKSSSKDDDDKDNGAGLGLMLMGAGLTTQTISHALRLMASRDAELKADRAAAEAYGASTMINALQKIERASARRPADLRNSDKGKAFAFAMISDGPDSASLKAKSKGGWSKVGRFFDKIGEATRTHPSIEKRVAALEKAAEDGVVPKGRASWW